MTNRQSIRRMTQYVLLHLCIMNIKKKKNLLWYYFTISPEIYLFVFCSYTLLSTSCLFKVLQLFVLFWKSCGFFSGQCLIISGLLTEQQTAVMLIISRSHHMVSASAAPVHPPGRLSVVEPPPPPPSPPPLGFSSCLYPGASQWKLLVAALSPFYWLSPKLLPLQSRTSRSSHDTSLMAPEATWLRHIQAHALDVHSLH